jgi:hypothetical protein
VVVNHNSGADAKPTNVDANEPASEPPVTIWSQFKEKIPSDSEILELQPRKDAYIKLQTAGVDGPKLLNRIRGTVLLTRMPLVRKGRWVEGTGKSLKTIRDVPRRIREMAEEMEPLINYPLLAPAFRKDEHAAALYPKLPLIMKAFSRLLEGQIPIASRLVANLNKMRAFPEKLKAHLCEWVGGQTNGRFFYEELSELLTAAYEADGRWDVIARENLKNLHERERSAAWPKPRIVELSLNPAERWVQVTVEP